MTFSYTGDPGLRSLDTVRFLTGDTLEGTSLLSDEEIRYLLANYADPRHAAVYGVRAMLGKCAGDTLVSADGIVRDIKERRQALQARLAELQQVGTLLATPFVGGVSRTTRDTRQEDEELIQPAFRRDQFDYLSTADSQERAP